jgi:DNA-binding CsgD family transcriptional regulator/PAS domain-containing protein
MRHGGDVLIEKFSEIVGSIYDCVAQETLWPAALAGITGHVDGFLAALAVFDTDSNSARLAQMACEDAFAVSELGKYAGTIPFYHLLHLMEIGEPVLLDRMFDLYGPDGEQVWRQTDLYRNWHAPFGVENSINMAVLKRPSRVATLNISVQRPPDAEQLARVALFAPHIRRAVTIHDLLQMERNEGLVFREMLDRMEHAVILVSEDMDLLYANPAAEAMLRDRALLSASQGRVSATLPRSQRAISRAITLGTRDEVSLAGQGIDVPLGVTSRPAVAHILPLARRTLHRGIEARAAAAIFIAAAGTISQTPVEAIAALFSLTFAEQRVAGYVRDGMTRFDIAQAQGVSEATVKTQLASIYDKTGTGDQRSLQGLMRELTPPVRRA